MPIPVANFQPIQPLSFEEANPFLKGVSATQGLIENLLRGQHQQLQNQQLKQENLQRPERLEQQLQQQKLANALSQIDIKYKPGKYEADIANTRSEIPLHGAQVNLYNTEAKYMPLKYAIEAANSARSSSRFGNAYQLASTLKGMPPAVKDAWIAQHQEEYTDMVNTLANKQAQQQENAGSNILASALKRYPEFGMQEQQNPAQQLSQRLAPQPTPQEQTLETAAEGTNLLPSYLKRAQQEVAQKDEAAMQKPFSSTPAQNAQLRNSAEMQANRKSVGSAINQRADAAVAIEKLLSDNRQEWSPKIKNAASFAGILGKSKKKMAQLALETPEEYKDYLWFKNAFRPNLLNQVKMMEKMGATDSQREELMNMVGAIDNWDLNPKAALDTLNQSIGTLQKVSDSVFQAAEPLFQGSYRKTYNLPKMEGDYVGAEKKSAPSYSEEDIQHTAKQYGISPEEVRKRLEGKKNA